MEANKSHMLEHKALLLILSKYHLWTLDLIGSLFVWHPIRVALRLSDPQDRVIALLHDTAETAQERQGQQQIIQEIKQDFGVVIAEAVEALTHRPEEVWEEYIMRLAKNKAAIRVKIEDLKDNFNRDRILFDEHTQQRARHYVWALQYLLKKTGIRRYTASSDF